jgi:peptide subunit release factor 1 (eRF1)
MTDVDACVVAFQCPKCGHRLEQTIAKLESQDHMRCPGCGVGINIDRIRLSNAADEIRKAVDKVPPEITIKFFNGRLNFEKLARLHGGDAVFRAGIGSHELPVSLPWRTKDRVKPAASIFDSASPSYS